MVVGRFVFRIQLEGYLARINVVAQVKVRLCCVLGECMSLCGFVSVCVAQIKPNAV